MEPLDLRLWSGFGKAGGNLSSPAIIDQIVIDSRRISSPHSLFVALPGRHTDGHQFVKQAGTTGARYALVKNDWQSDAPLGPIILLRVEDPLASFQEIAYTYRKQFPVQVIGICGSYGKTMVKDLLQVLVAKKRPVVASPESFNSQIGVALSLLKIRKEHEIAIIEAGISETGEMDTLCRIIEPHSGILTHIGKKHLTTLGDIGTVAVELVKMLTSLPTEGWALMPDDPLLQPHLPKIVAKQTYWNRSSHHLPHASALSNEHSLKMPYQVHFPDGRIFMGEANSGFYYHLDLINITVKAAWKLGIPSDSISETLKYYIAEPSRTEIWKSPHGATFINDTYCSDPQSVDRSLKFFDQALPSNRKIFLFGGMRDHQKENSPEYRHIGRALKNEKVHLLLLYGKTDFTSLAEEVKNVSPSTEIAHYPNYKKALEALNEQIQANDLILIKGPAKTPLDSLTEAFNDSICNNQCVINLSAIQSNIETIRHRIAPNTRLMVMVKAFAYGTDDVRMAKFLTSCDIDILGVSYVDEGVTLKRAGVTQKIFAINAAIHEAAKVVKWSLEVGVSDKLLIQALAAEARAQNKKVPVHLHIDTGMSRFGCRPEEALALAEQIASSPFLILEGLMTHFACADNPNDDPFTKQQIACFESVIANLKVHGYSAPWIHAANSSATVRFDLSQFNMIRIGLAVYGLYSSEATKAALELRLAISLNSRIVGINICKTGETISYGRSYKVSRDKQKIAVIPIGYFDGLHRNYSGKGHVIIRSHKAPMVGKICMDYMMVDVSDIPNVSIGDPVLIFGEDEHGNYLSPEELANQGNSIVHELITCLGPRIQRVFIYEEAKLQR